MKILVSGLLNIETTLAIEGFPIEYSPVRYSFGGVSSSVSGVGMNLALALQKLGDEVSFQTIVGDDDDGRLARDTVAKAGIGTGYVVSGIRETARSVILYDPQGRRQINVDLKDIQETRYPPATYHNAARGCAAACLCNVNFNRDLLPIAKKEGLPVFTDVHTLSDAADAYNGDFMAAAKVLFLSDERLWAPPQDVAFELMDRYGNDVIVIGRGEKGALLLEKGAEPRRFEPVNTRKVVSTIGAGDALFSAFTHFYLRGRSATEALQRAMYFASWKIGEKGTASGFLSEGELEEGMK